NQKSDETKDEKKQEWVVEILDASEKIVKSYKFDSTGKQKIEWDGKDEKGNKMSDGVYKVKLHSTDKAGNYWEKFINNIIINTEPTPIEAVVSSKIFSPNGDGAKDTIGFKFNVPNKKGIVKWNYDILTGDDKLIKSFSGEGLPPNEISWNGKDNGDNYSKEGSYKGKLSLTYENGNMPFGETPVFSIDLTPPAGALKLSRDIFSPNGDGKTDDVNVVLSTSDEDEWLGDILDESGKKVKSFLWKGKPPKQFAWDGKDNDNKLLPDGNYFFRIASTDTAGNYFETDKTPVKIFTEDTPVFIVANVNSFNPSGVKNKQIFDIKAKIAKDNKVLNYEINVKDDKDNVVWTLKKEGDLPQSVEWDGKNNDKKVCDDGYYTATLKVNFSATDAQSVTAPFIIDGVFPSIDIASVSPVFSPNKDKRLDTYEVLQKGSEESQWQAKILDDANNVLWETFYSGRPNPKEVWDGFDMSGNLSKNGFYKYSISCTDEAGNTTTKELTAELKNVYTVAYITLDDDKFSPNKDGKFDILKFRPFVNVKEDLEDYKIEVFDQEKNVVKTFSGTKSIPEVIDWDGVTDKGGVSKDGFYTFKLSVIYRFGNNPNVESAQFVLDTTAPDINLTYDPQYFSPDEDGVDDELSISIKSYDLSGIKDWKINVFTPDKNKNFYDFSGTGKPTDKIVWEGK
ncbi:MAG TPA: FlgD immunoglobulin-like domain containing protein, partial [Spirochaetota bacterium]|nr:FlgD immunoglobulin-like domain containing protein [Spirochaetota bacterium]